MTIAMQQRGVLTPWIGVIRTVTSRPDDLVGAAARVIAPIASGEPAQTRVQALARVKAFDPTGQQRSRSQCATYRGATRFEFPHTAPAPQLGRQKAARRWIRVK